VQKKRNLIRPAAASIPVFRLPTFSTPFSIPLRRKSAFLHCRNRARYAMIEMIPCDGYPQKFVELCVDLSGFPCGRIRALWMKKYPFFRQCGCVDAVPQLVLTAKQTVFPHHAAFWSGFPHFPQPLLLTLFILLLILFRRRFAAGAASSFYSMRQGPPV